MRTHMGRTSKNFPKRIFFLGCILFLGPQGLLSVGPLGLPVIFVSPVQLWFLAHKKDLPNRY
jgi:hypothetical protein